MSFQADNQGFFSASSIILGEAPMHFRVGPRNFMLYDTFPRESGGDNGRTAPAVATHTKILDKPGPGPL